MNRLQLSIILIALTAWAQTAIEPKKPGTIRIGVQLPGSQMGPGAASVAEPLRKSIMNYLAGPAIEVVSIAALLPDQANLEGIQKQCDYVFASSLTQKKGSESGRAGFLKGAASLSSQIPMLGAAHGAAGAVAGVAAGSALSGAAGAAGSVKAKSEVTFEFRLIEPQTAAATLSNSFKAKAQQDGEDVITPLVEQAAASVVKEILKK